MRNLKPALAPQFISAVATALIRNVHCPAGV